MEFVKPGSSSSIPERSPVPNSFGTGSGECNGGGAKGKGSPLPFREPSERSVKAAADGTRAPNMEGRAAVVVAGVGKETELPGEPPPVFRCHPSAPLLTGSPGNEPFKRHSGRSASDGTPRARTRSSLSWHFLSCVPILRSSAEVSTVSDVFHEEDTRNAGSPDPVGCDSGDCVGGAG